MADKIQSHDLVSAVKKLANTLGRVPRLSEFIASSELTNPRMLLTLAYPDDGYPGLLLAAGLDKRTRNQIKIDSDKIIRQYKTIISRKEQLQGHFRHVLDLADLFARAGNPEVLKLSAQPDTHGKERDEPAFNCYLNFLEFYQPHVHLILGDYVNCDGASPWPQKNLEPKRLVPEMKIGREMLGRTVEKTPTCSSRIFLEGNHENWIIQALTQMPEIFEGLEDLGIQVNLKALLALEKYGYELFPVNHFIQIGGAHFTHGLYTSASHAKKHLDQMKVNLYYGHLHDIQEHNQTAMEGGMEAASLGCLTRLDAEFLRGKPNNWVHSHSTFEFFRDGSYHRLKHLIKNGRTTFNGKVFQG